MSEQTVALITGLVVEIIKPIVAVLAAAILALVLRKLGIAVDAEKQAKFEKDVLDAVARWEEKGASNQLGAMPDKLSGVVADISRAYPKKEVPDIVDAVHALLPRIGLGATAAKIAQTAVGAVEGFQHAGVVEEFQHAGK